MPKKSDSKKKQNIAKNIKPGFGAVGIILIILLLIRLLFQIISIFLTPGAALILIFISIIYLIAVIGIGTKKKWGSIMTGIIALIDILFAVLLVGGAIGFGAVVYDIAILVLAYLEYKG